MLWCRTSSVVSWRGMMGHYHADSGRPGHTNGTGCALWSSANEVRGAVVLCGPISSPRTPIAPQRWEQTVAGVIVFLTRQPSPSSTSPVTPRNPDPRSTNNADISQNHGVIPYYTASISSNYVQKLPRYNAKCKFMSYLVMPENHWKIIHHHSVNEINVIDRAACYMWVFHADLCVIMIIISQCQRYRVACYQSVCDGLRSATTLLNDLWFLIKRDLCGDINECQLTGVIQNKRHYWMIFLNAVTTHNQYLTTNVYWHTHSQPRFINTTWSSRK